MSGVYMIRKNRKRRENYLEIGSKCATIYIPYTHSQQFQFFDYIPKFRCWTELGNLFQIKGPRKWTELVP